MDYFVDCHLHLQGFGDDRDEMINQAVGCGVRYMVCNGSCEDDWQIVADIAAAHDCVIPCFGLHPWYVENRSQKWLAKLIHMLGNGRSGIGEAGLDKNKGPSLVEQQDVLRAQLKLAKEMQKPIEIHCLDAWGTLIETIKDFAPLAFMLHAYSGSQELIKPLAKMGAYFSFAPNVLNERYKTTRQSLMQVPHDRLLIETDSPDIELPKWVIDKHGFKGRKSLPAFLPTAAFEIANVLNMQAKDFARITTQNAAGFFGINI